MLKYFIRVILVAGAVLFAAPAIDAKMTDDQVVEYIKQQSAAGKSEKQIGQELLAKGVTPDQIERLKSKYASNSNTTTSGLVTKGGDVNAERRVNPLEDVTGDKLDEVSSNIDDNVKGATHETRRSIFGHDVFNNRALSFEPNANIATPKNYRLGPGDEVVIDIWGASEDRIRQTISPEGSIMISQIGPVYLNGLTIADANERVKDLFAQKYAGVEEEETDVALSLGQIRTIQVNVMGDVAIPGTYRLSPFSNVFHALYRAGGISNIGSMRNIQLVRDGRIISDVDIYDFLFEGKEADNVRLMEGDVIVVPPYNELVLIQGNVKRPMYYEIKKGETLGDVLKYSGGFTGDAYVDKVNVSRQENNENKLYNVSQGEFANYRLKDGDNISVGTILDRYSNRVEIKGSVMRPGLYAIGDSMSTLRELISTADGLMEDAYMERALLYRQTDDLSLEVIPVDLAGLMTGTVADVKLNKNDLFVVSSIHELNDRGNVIIEGPVSRPGSYAYADKMTVNDLILMSGGLLQGASTSRVDISRRIIDPESMKPTDATAHVYSFALENGLAIADGAEFVLQPYDIVEVRYSPGYQVQKMVTVKGEVLFSGNFALRRRNERLSDIVKRAGGLIDGAYIKGASLSRRMTDDEVLARNETLRLAMQGSSDSISIEKLNLSDRYNVGIDLDKALSNPGSYYDVVLREGDVLNVPEQVTTVKIAGEVLFPNTVNFVPGKKLKYYIDQAGGYGNQAKKSKVFIVYMNGQVTKAKGSSPIEPGCQIIVPSKPKRDGMKLAEILAISSSLASLGTMAATIYNIIK